MDGRSTIELKCDKQPFEDVASWKKLCEVRRDDRDFKVGDLLVLRETVHTGEEMRDGSPLDYTGRYTLREITHIQRGYGLPDGLCVLSLGVA